MQELVGAPGTRTRMSPHHVGAPSSLRGLPPSGRLLNASGSLAEGTVRRNLFFNPRRTLCWTRCVPCVPGCWGSCLQKGLSVKAQLPDNLASAKPPGAKPLKHSIRKYA